MISNKGKEIIKQVFTGQTPRIGDTLALGTGITPPTAADTALAAEVYRIKVVAINADTNASRIVFKAVVPANIVVVDAIHEVALFNGSDLVARTVLDTPITLDAFLPNEIEYSLAVAAA